MKTRSVGFTIIVLIFITLFVIADPAQALNFPLFQHTNNSSSAFRVLESDLQEYSIEVRPAYPQLSNEIKHPYQTYTIDEFNLIETPGHPRLPVKIYSIGIPPDGNFQIDYETHQPQTLDGQYTIEPARSPVPAEASLQPGTWEIREDPTIYSSTDLYPIEPVQIIDEGWFRELRFVHIAVYPLQYSPATGQVNYIDNLTITVTFPTGRTQSTQLQSLQQTTPNAVFESLYQDHVVNFDSAKNWLRQSSPETDRATVETSLGDRFRIPITEDGIYKLTHSDLSGMGLDLSTVDPQNFKLMNQWREVSIYISGQDDGQFNENDYIIFYGEKYTGDIMADRYADEDDDWLTYFTQDRDGNTIVRKAEQTPLMMEKYTDENVYWLVVGSSPGLRMAVGGMDPADIGSAPVTSYMETVYREEQNEWWITHFTNEESFYWERLNSSNLTAVYDATLSNRTTSSPEQATIRGEIVSQVNSNSISPDSHVSFSINSTPFLDETWDGESRLYFEEQINPGLLINGTNLFGTSMITDTDVSPIAYFDWFEIEYERNLVALNNQITFTNDNGGEMKFDITGFSSLNSPFIFDVTQSHRPRRIQSAEITTSTVTFGVDQDTAKAYFIANGNGVQTPSNINYYQDPGLLSESQGAEYIIITHQDFLPASQQLASYRQSRGLSTMVVDVQDLYNEFTFGIFNPLAIKDFIRYAYNNYATQPVYVVLIGDGNWNMNYYQSPNFGDEPVYIPPYLAFVDPWQGEVDSTNSLATIVGDDAMPDVMIGRIPVNSAAELSAYINKVINYESLPRGAAWQKNIAFVADNTPDTAGDFVASSEAIITDFITPSATYTPIRVYEDDFNCINPINTPIECNSVTSAITNTYEIDGALLINYTGHASISRWSDESIWLTEHLPGLNNGDMTPVLVSMTCLDGYWIGPGGDKFVSSLSEDSLLLSSGGSIASFAPAGLGVASGHDIMHQGFYESLFDNGNWEIGAASMNAKLKLFNYGYYYDLINTYLTFGDPALQIIGDPIVVGPTELYLPSIQK